MKKSPIYFFYEIVPNGADSTPGDDGDVHYCCLHGSHKICTIKKSMRSNLNGKSYAFIGCLYRLTLFLVLVNNLRVHIKPMYRLYCFLKDREQPPTDHEIAYVTARCDETLDHVTCRK
jgi:hypothetical protein